jgi:hypothetical protein
MLCFREPVGEPPRSEIFLSWIRVKRYIYLFKIEFLVYLFLSEGLDTRIIAA